MDRQRNTASDLFWILIAAAVLVITVVSLFSAPSAGTRVEKAFETTRDAASEDLLNSLLFASLENGSLSYTEGSATLFSLALSGKGVSAEPAGVAADEKTLSFETENAAYAIDAKTAAMELAGIPLGDAGLPLAAAGVWAAENAGIYREFFEILKEGFSASGTEERELSLEGSRVTADVLLFTAGEEEMTEAFNKFLARAREADGASAILSLEAALRAFCGEDVRFDPAILSFLSDEKSEVSSASGGAKVLIRKDAAVGLELLFTVQGKAKWEITFTYTAQDRASSKWSAALTLKRTSGAKTDTLTARITDRVTESGDTVYARQTTFEVTDPALLFLSSRTELARKIALTWDLSSQDLLIRATLNGEDYTVKGSAVRSDDGTLTVTIRSASKKVQSVLEGVRTLILSPEGEVRSPAEATADLSALSGDARQRLFVLPAPEPEPQEEPNETQPDPTAA